MPKAPTAPTPISADDGFLRNEYRLGSDVISGGSSLSVIVTVCDTGPDCTAFPGGLRVTDEVFGRLVDDCHR